MIDLIDLACDAAEGVNDRALVLAARAHRRVELVSAWCRAVAADPIGVLWFGSVRHCRTCLVVAPRGAACACIDSRPAPAPIPPGEPAPGPEVGVSRRAFGVCGACPYPCSHDSCRAWRRAVS